MTTTLSKPPFRISFYPRESWTWGEFLQSRGCHGSIALDGMVLGGPRYDEETYRINFDHHDSVIREATMSTCMQVYMALKGGLMERFLSEFTEIYIYVNDTDQDTSLAVWLLLNYKLFTGTKTIPVISRLLQLNNFWDITGGAFPIDLQDKIVRQHNWVFEPYTALRKTGALSTATPEVLRDNLEAILTRLNTYMMGEAGEEELDARYELLGTEIEPECWFVDEIGGNTARYLLFQRGMPAFVSIVARRPDGKTVYSIGRRSRYIKFPLPAFYAALSRAETSGGVWGGSDIIGGSPRKEGSTLTWQEIRDIIRAEFKNHI